jgi:nickel-dependent lactate racemase
VPNATRPPARRSSRRRAARRSRELLDGADSVAVIIDNQFRPTPASKLLPPVLDAIEAAGVDACVITANGKVFPLSESDIEQKVGRENLDRMEKLGIPLFQNEPRNADAIPYIGVTSRGTPVWIPTRWSRRDVKIAIGQAQANHWGYGGGGKLIMPGVSSDETIESNHCNFVPSPQTHYGALAGPMRSDIDEVATMCGLDATMNVLLDTRGRVIELNFGRTRHRIACDRALSTRSTPTKAPSRERASRHRDLRRLRADRPPLLPYRLGLHVGGLRAQGRRDAHLLQPVARVHTESATSRASR